MINTLMRIFIFIIALLFSANAKSDVNYSRCKTVRESIVQPVMTHLEIHNRALEDLIVGTIAVESASGKYTRQHFHGPARGIIQIEPDTYTDLVNRNLLLPTVLEMGNNFKQVEKDHFYAVGVAISYYMWKMERYKLPEDNYLDHEEYIKYLYELAGYWKKNYNTHLGAGSKTGFVSAWFRYGCYLDNGNWA